MNLIQSLKEKGLVNPPYFIPENTAMLAIGGSYAYGTNNDMSDRDIWGICIPPRHYIFPNEAGIIPGFGTQGPKFEVWQEHHIYENEIEYDLNIYSIIKFFELARQGNPNILDFLFVPEQCIIHITKVGSHIRENRKLFISKDMWPRFKGFAFNHLKNMKYAKTVGRRAGLVEKFGYDVKDAGHLCRVLLSLEDAMTDGEYDLRRHKDMIKSIRNGVWTYEQVCEWFAEKEKHLETLKLKSSIPEHADEMAIKKVLIECLETHYGSLHNVIKDDNRPKQMLREILSIIENGKHLL